MKKRSLQHLMRSLHRDLGFLVIGFTIIFAVSGIALVYRGTNFLTYEKEVVKTIDANLSKDELGRELRFRRFNAEQHGDSLLFDNGYYLISTGELNYSYRTLPEIVHKFNRFHMQSKRSSFHVLAVIYGILLLFLAISSLFMFKPGTRKFVRGIVLTVIGLIVSGLFVMLL